MSKFKRKLQRGKMPHILKSKRKLNRYIKERKAAEEKKRKDAGTI